MDGRDLAAGMAGPVIAFMVLFFVVSAVAGWALIEGAIWLFHHVHIW